MAAEPAPASRAAVFETHISTVFLVGQRAYKVKKPIRTDFLDLTTADARVHACAREVELNRRLAPDVYLGVAGLSDVTGGRPEPVLVMRRMPEDRRLSSLVRSGVDLIGAVRGIARTIAAFHARAETSPTIADAGRVEHLRALWRANTRTMNGFVGGLLDGALVARAAHLADRYLDGRGTLFETRRARGCVRDGHGDLLADDIFCLDDGPRILDCLEFDDTLRHGDVLADVAFLAMDLERLGAPNLARSFLSAYREFSAETHPSSLEHHYIAYRAHVRAMVSCLRSAQGDATVSAQARALLALSCEHLERGRVRLVLVGGAPGSGKSTLARGLADQLGWTLLRSDALRKDLVGVERTEHPVEDYGTGLYDAESTARTYETLLDRARSLVSVGESVILDASWHDAAWRRRAYEMAASTATDLVELRCRAPVDVLHARLAARRRTSEDPSDATAAIAARMASETDAWPEATVLDTDRPLAEAAAAALEAVVSG